MKRNSKIYFAILFLILLTAFVPVNFLTSNFQTQNQILVTHQECTDCADVRIIKGKLNVTKSNLKKSTSDFELCLIGNNQYVNKSVTKNYSFFIENEFYIEGKIVGYDTIHYENNVPIFDVKTWKTSNYYPFLLTTNNTIISIYILCFIAIISLTLISFLQKRNHLKQK